MRVDEMIERLKEIPPYYEVKLAWEIGLEKEDIRLDQRNGVVGVMIPEAKEARQELSRHERPCHEAQDCKFYNPKFTK